MFKQGDRVKIIHYEGKDQVQSFYTVVECIDGLLTVINERESYVGLNGKEHVISDDEKIVFNMRSMGFVCAELVQIRK